MIELSLGEVAEIVVGTLADADPRTVVTGGVEFDSRKVHPGDLFLALPGEHVDGHDFAAAATAAGAVASIVTRPTEGPSIQVADGLAALAALAREVLHRLPQCTVIGVTGSSGKTSTKDLLAALLAPTAPTIAPPGSFNNELGHPYTVLKADARTRFLVLEKSARNVGHIRYLTEIAPPRIGVVLNVGSAHLGIFGSRQAIAQAKGELVEALPADGAAVLNADDPLVAEMAARTAARVVRFGHAAHADVRAVDVSLDEIGRARFTLVTADGARPVRLRLVGGHHVSNALAAATAALECGVGLDDVAARLSAATPTSRWRMELTERRDGVLLLNDAYNANPESMRAALDTLTRVSGQRPDARCYAVLGQMAELGADAPAAHEELGRLAADLGVDEVLAIGAEARPICAGIVTTGTGTRCRPVPDVDAAVAVLRAELRPGDVVLVKASRAASLERVVAAIADDEAPRHEPHSAARSATRQTAGGGGAA
jgi:UDP-N-acetylmuramoyl-tripeptide--D-alanyl-D-alanine ligase